MSEFDLAAYLAEACKEMDKIPAATVLYMDEQGGAVELYTDQKIPTYGEWIQGEGSDICLLRCQETNRVVGVRLPMRHSRLMVSRYRKDKKQKWIDVANEQEE